MEQCQLRPETADTTRAHWLWPLRAGIRCRAAAATELIQSKSRTALAQQRSSTATKQLKSALVGPLSCASRNETCTNQERTGCGHGVQELSVGRLQHQLGHSVDQAHAQCTRNSCFQLAQARHCSAPLPAVLHVSLGQVSASAASVQQMFSRRVSRGLSRGVRCSASSRAPHVTAAPGRVRLQGLWPSTRRSHGQVPVIVQFGCSLGCSLNTPTARTTAAGSL